MSALNETLLRKPLGSRRDSFSIVLPILTGCKHLIDLRSIFEHHSGEILFKLGLPIITFRLFFWGAHIK